MDHGTPLEHIRAATLKLLAYCRASGWAGYDPYDALNSRLFEALPFLNSRIPRLCLTQALKRSPVNVRPLALVPKTQNPKALALFLASVLKIEDWTGAGREDVAHELTDRLIALKSPGSHYWCWGYSFPWQTRTAIVPRWSANVVCTSFVANALLDAYERRGESRTVIMAASAARYVRDELYWRSGGETGLRYPLPDSPCRIHNANLLGAALLCRVYKTTGDSRLVDPALDVARYSCARQHDDGSWPYAEEPGQHWIDNFHTGYNLCALASIGRLLCTTEFQQTVRRGLEFYREHFFREDGAPRYFHDRTYPIDIHSVAQSIITLAALQAFHPDNLRLAHAVLRWALANMWNERGYFYYRVHRFGTIRTSYMRWSQAWMLLAMSTLLDECTAKVQQPVRTRALA